MHQAFTLQIDPARPVACQCRCASGSLQADAPSINPWQAAQHGAHLALNIFCVLQSRCIVHDMASTTDYRRLAQHHRGLYFTDDQRDQELDTRFEELIGHQEPQQATVEVQMGRKIRVPAAGGSQLSSVVAVILVLWTSDTLCLVSSR